MSDKKIELIATDLDGTLLDYQMELSQDNKDALEQAAAKGIMLVIATGRSFLSIPDVVKDIKGVAYCVSANGAKIHRMPEGELVDGQYIALEAIDAVSDVLRTNGIMLEVFVEGIPYVYNWDYVNPHIFGTTESYLKYFAASRNPVEDIFKFIEDNKPQIENINLVFRSPRERIDTLARLQDIQDKMQNFTITSSFPFNLEVGGLDVDKFAAIEKICKNHHILNENVMCLGDNSNDRSMIEYAGVGVAMKDAVPEVIEVADFVTKKSSESGVAFAVKKYIL